jgi:hypothetical protein
MRMFVPLAAAVTLIATMAVSAETAPPPTADKAALATKLATDELEARSSDFWSDWNKTKASEEYTALKTSVGLADKAKAAAAASGGKQAIADLALVQPEAAAKLMNSASAAPDDAANALSTVVNMVTAPATREAAMTYVEPEAATRVESWNANLSSGVQGLPGIYLGAPAETSAGTMPTRAAVPSGYTPVAGASAGCSTR